MILKCRAWDGEKYWFSDNNLVFFSGGESVILMNAPFDINAIELYTNKIDMQKIPIYENDLIIDTNQDKIYQVIWDINECGFRKILQNNLAHATKIDSAFCKVIGTIHT